jgi:predicted lipoprotein with Yx(FWY)xxD motif
MNHRRLIAAAAPLILILAACASGPAATGSPTQAVASQAPVSQAPASAAPTASDDSSGSPEIELEVATGSGSIGSYLTGADGKTLYIFTKDTKGAGKSVCNGDCATAWPPLVVSALDEVKPDSGAAGALALVTRDDGTKQVSYNGQPLYYYTPDKAAGDTTGQGVGGVWFVAAP